ncbi:PTS sugar transporter subunit IIC [Enterococcus hirae]
MSWGLSRGVPIFIVFSFGDRVIQIVSDVIPEWLTGGLAVAGGMLPAVGIAILLRFLPVKNFITYLMIGFLAVAYLKMPMFGVALLGLALAILQFKNLIGKQNNLTQVAQADANGKGGLSANEYED